MKLFYFILYSLVCFGSLYAQINTAKLPNVDYIRYLRHPETSTVNLSYVYCNKWDFDGDGKMDSIYFIGNGGVHTYFFLRIILSSDQKVRNFPFIQLDMPYFQSRELFERLGKNAVVQFVPSDFDGDGVMDLYLNFDNYFSYIPKAWRKEGIMTKCVVMSFKGAKLKVRNYSNREGSG